MRYLIVVFMFIASVVHAAKIAVATVSIGEGYSWIVNDCIENKRLYCQLHGYDFICLRENLAGSRPFAWNKIKVLQNSLQDYDWVFWSDADSLITNMTIKLEDFIDDRFVMIVAHDMNGMNTGQFLLKNCPESFDLLNGSYQLTRFIYHPWWDQAAIRQYLEDHPSLLDLVKVVPQRSINSYPPEEFANYPESVYQKGDFVIHFPGVRGAQLKQLIDRYKNDWLEVGQLN